MFHPFKKHRSIRVQKSMKLKNSALKFYVYKTRLKFQKSVQKENIHSVDAFAFFSLVKFTNEMLKLQQHISSLINQLWFLTNIFEVSKSFRIFKWVINSPIIISSYTAQRHINTARNIFTRIADTFSLKRHGIPVNARGNWCRSMINAFLWENNNFVLRF